MYRASCLCGAIEAHIRGSIESIIHCHCSLCRKNSGTAFATNGFVKRNDFRLIKGEGDLTRYCFTSGGTRYFCQHCGSPIYSANQRDPERIRLRLGCLDSDIEERPSSHNFVSSKANWEDLDTLIPRYDSFEPSRKFSDTDSQQVDLS